MGGKLVGYLLYTLTDGRIVGFEQAKTEDVTGVEVKEQTLTKIGVKPLPLGMGI